MSSLWGKHGTSWELLKPQPFPDEATLHSLIEEAPQMLPLLGDPRLTIVGREVYLAGNYIDLMAVEDSGRLAIIEIKLKKSVEARRAVVAQILTYAASLKGLDQKTVEQLLLISYLNKLHVTTLLEAAALEDQSGQIDPSIFTSNVTGCLENGRFRLVLVLDDAPPELVRLVGYLEAMTEGLIIDLITVNMFDIDGRQVVVPRRVDPAEDIHNVKTSAGSHAIQGSHIPKPVVLEGSDAFAEAISRAQPDDQPVLRRLVDWARGLEQESLVRLWTTIGTTGRRVLNLHIPDAQVGLISIYNEPAPNICSYRSVFDRRAPNSIAVVESAMKPQVVGQQTWTDQISDDLTTALAGAYHEAASTSPVVNQQLPGPSTQ